MEYLVNLATTISHERLDDARVVGQQRRTRRPARQAVCAPIGAALPYGCVAVAA